MAKKEDLNPYLINLGIALERIGRSKTWLALECGLSPSSIVNMFARNQYPSVNTAAVISTVLGYPIEQMLKGDVKHYQPAGKSKRELMTNKIMGMCQELDENELEYFQSIMRNIVDLRRLVQ
jgi:hypothetical protein